MRQLDGNKEDKPKRAPSAYNLFVQAHMKEWKDACPTMWWEAPENPNRGKEVKLRKPKAAAGTPKAKASHRQVMSRIPARSTTSNASFSLPLLLTLYFSVIIHCTLPHIP
ncbi:hypothetical protein DEU56DRAFT_914073 [Suillus clintonianus]|uniref:uncharacterized protein n=1 Tax=Suillus clintonianus TaxID=1904413 RepID=UPI001B86670D|nr:uncharacterized protein DEU56DRAFT_914073 [Suillus clintonianus]KAG2132747.1 hypothetical protein DEU56DRAFT_914073 [Suillus clintonianus]